MSSIFLTSLDRSPLSHHNFPVKSFLQSSIGLPKVSFYDIPEENSIRIKVEVEHDGRHFEVSDKHYVVDAQKDREYYIRVIHRLADRLLVMVINDETERWIDLTP